MQQKILANVGFKNDYSYTKSYSAIDDGIFQTIVNGQRLDTPLYFSANGIPVQTSAEAMEKLNKIIDIVKNGGEYYAFDLETLGKFDGTREEQKAFAITEASLKRFTFENGQLKVNTVQDLRLGLNKEQLSVLRGFYTQAQLNPKNLTESQIFTLKTLSATGSALKSNNLNTFQIGADGMPIIPRLNGQVADTLDYGSINHALNAYEDLIGKGLYINNVKGANSTFGNKMLNQFISNISSISNDGLILGHNSNVFDIPALKFINNKFFGNQMNIGAGSIDTLELFNLVGLNAQELYKNQNIDINSGFAKLENLSSLFNVNVGTTHVGSDDVSRLGMLGSATINFNGNNKTLFEIMADRASSNISGAQRIKSNNANTFRVVQAPGLRDLQGNFMTGDRKSFDFSIDITDSGSYQLNKWGRSPLHAGGFYNFEDFVRVDVNSLVNSGNAQVYNEMFKNLPEGTKELYVGIFSNMADPSKKSFIVRDSMTSLQRTIESTFELSNGTTIDTILKEEKMYNRDLARREMSHFEQPGTKGMGYANIYYSQLKELEEYEEIIGRAFTEDELRNVVKNKRIEIGDYLFNDVDVFNKLTYKGSDELISSRVNAFIEARKYLNSTAPVANTFAPVINKAYKDLTDKDYGKNGQTLAYRSSWRKLDNWISTNGGSLITQSNELSNISKSKTFRIEIGKNSGEFYSLDLSSKDKLKRSLKSIANKEVLNNINTNTKDLAKSQNLDSLYNKLEDLLTPEQIQSLRKNKSISYEIEEAAEYIYENSKSRYANITNNELRDPTNSRNRLKTLLGYEKLTDGQKDIINDKINKLDWIINNTAANIESLDFDKGARVKVGKQELSIMDFIKSKGYNPTDLLEMMAQDSVNETISMPALLYDSKIGKTDLSRLTDILFGKLNWTEKEIEQFSKTMTSEKGVLNVTNSMGDKSLAWAFVETSDTNSRNSGIKLVLTDQKHLGTLTKAVENGDLNNGKFVVIDMPSRINKDGINVIKKGGMEVSDIQTINLFGRANPKDLDVAQTLFTLSTGELNKARHIDMDSSTYVGQMISKLSVYKNDIFDAIENNIGQVLSSRYNRSINKDIQKSSGFTGYSNVLDENGNLIKKFIGNYGDISKNNMVDTTNLINLLPMLAKEDDGVNSDLNTIFARANKNMTWNEYRDKWINELTNPVDKYGKARAFGEIDSAVREYYVKNLLGQNGLINMFLNSESIKSVTGYTRVLPLLEQISKSGSQLLSSKMVQDGYVTLKGANVVNAGSDIVGPMRDLIVQQTQYTPIHLGTVQNFMTNGMDFNDYIKELNSRGITLGRTFGSTDSSVLDLLNRSANEGVIEGITGKVKLMNDEEILNRINNFKSSLNSNSARNFANKYNLYSGLNDAEIINALKDQLSVFESRSMTYQQRGFANPALYNLINSTPDIHQFNINDITDLKVSKGSSVKDGTVLGYDKNGKAIIYKDKRAGTIVGIDNGKISVNPFEKAVHETKFNYGITEKSTVDIFEDTPIFRALYDELIGRDVAMVAYPNQSKHLAGMFAFNEMNTIGQYLLQYGSDSQQQEFANLLNAIGGSDSRLDVKEINGQKVKRFLYGHSSEGNTYEQYKSVVDNFMGIAKSRSNDPFYGKLVQNIESNRANHEAVLDISIMQHNTQFSSQSDEYMEDVTGHHGGKWTMRDATYIERKVGHHPDAEGKFYHTNPDGTKTPTSKILVDTLYDQIRQTDEFISAQQDIKNIQYSIKLQRGISTKQAEQDIAVANEMLVKKVKLSDLHLPTSDTNSERIAETIFGIGEGHNVIELDLEDMKILDPLTGERTNKFYVPVLKNQFIDGGDMLVKLDTQKSITEFYNNLQKLMLNKEIDRKYAEHSIKKFWDETYYSIENKDGYLNQKVTSGRLPFSSNALYGGIVSPLYDDDMNLKYEKFNVNLKRNIGINDKSLTGIIDVNYITEQSLKEMLGDRALEDIGFQLAHNDYDSNDRFKKLIQELGLADNKLDEKAYEEIGRQFMLTEGIAGISTRYPAFNTGASVVTTVRLNPVTDKGTSILTMAHTALKQNADVDYDTQKLALLGQRDLNGRFKFYEKGTTVRGAIEDLIDAESLDNIEHWIPSAKADEYDKLAKNNANGIITPEQFKAIAEKSGMKNGRWDSEDVINAIANARYKKAIADMSTPNYMLFHIGTSMYEMNKGAFNGRMIKDLQDFTQLVEQSPISAKFASISTTKKRINASAEYATSIAETITAINKGESIDTPFEKIVNSLGNMDILDSDNLAKATDSLGLDTLKILSSKDYMTNGNIEKILDVMAELGSDRGKQSTLLYGLSSMHNMFNNDFLLSAWFDTNFRYRNLKDYDFIDSMAKLSNGEVDTTTLKGQIMHSILNAPDTMAYNKTAKFERVGSVRNKVYYDVDGRMYSVGDGVGLQDGSMMFNIRSTDNEVSYMYKNTYDNALSQSNKSINEFLKNEVGLKELEIAGELSAEDLKMFENTNYASTYIEGRNIIEDYNSKKMFKSRENYINVLDEYNKKIIEAGRNAKDINSVRSYSLLKDIMSMNMTSLYKNFDYESFTEDYAQNYSAEGSALRMSNIGDRAISGNGIKKLSNRGGIADNILYKSIAPDFSSYYEELTNTVDNIISNDKGLNSLDSSRKQSLLNAVIQRTDNILSETEMPNINKLTSKLVDLYKNNVDEFRNNYSWGLDINSALASIDLTTDDGIKNSIETVEAFGEARVGFGRYTGHKVSTLSSNQIKEIREADFLAAAVNNVDSDFINESMNAINNYEIIKGYVASENVTNNEEVNRVLDRTASSSNRNYTTNMQNILNEDQLKKDIISYNDEMNEIIIRKGKAKTRKTIQDNINKADESFMSHMSGKAFIAGAGILAATTMMMSYSGLASSLDPGQTPSAKREEAQMSYTHSSPRPSQTPRYSGSAYMTPRTSTRIRMNSPNGSVNDPNVLRALNFAGGPNARVQINERNGQNNNSWLQNEIANNLV